MCVELQFRDEIHGLQEYEFVFVLVPRRGNNSIELMRMYTDKFIFPKDKVRIRKRIDDEAVGESWGTLRKWLFVDQMIGEVTVEFIEAFLILCQANIGLTAAIAEINTNYRMNSHLLGSADKWENSRGAIDISERNSIDPLGFCIRNQCVDRHRTEFETEMGMAVGEHGYFERSEKSPLVFL